jgi:hypothetical protein
MVSTPNTQGLYGAAANDPLASAGNAGPLKDSRDIAGEANTEWARYQAEQKRLADEAAAREAAAKQAAATSDEAYAQSLEAWKKKALDWTGGQTHFSGGQIYQIPIMQARARQAAGAAPAATTAIQRQLLANTMASMSGPSTAAGYYGSGAGYGRVGSR